MAENVAPQPKKQVGENYRRVDAAGTVTDKISRVLSALHDSDFDASDIAGEMRCPMSEAQNGFIHLIKRGLLVWMLLLLPVALWSQGIHESWSDNDVSGTCDITFSDVQPSFERSERVDKMTGDRYITYNAYNVPFKKAFDVFLKVHLVHGDWDNLKGHKQKWWASAQLGADNNVTFHKCNGIDNRFDLETEYRVMRSQKKAVVVCSAGKKTIYVYVYASDDEGTTDQSAAVPYTATEEEPEPEEPQAEEPAQPASPNDIIVDSEAGDIPDASQTDIHKESTDGADDWWGKWGIPTLLISVGTGSGVAVRNHRKKKKDKEKDEDAKEEEEEESYSYEMRISKHFGGSLCVGNNPLSVYAYIARIDQHGSEKSDEMLTRMIQIEGDGYLEVSGHCYQEGTMCALVCAPETAEGYEPPAMGVVHFRLSAAQGHFTNRMHIVIAQPTISFAQENLTLPADYEETARLPFLIQNIGQDELAGCEAEIEGDYYEVTCEPSDQYPQIWFACIREKMQKKKEVWEAGKSSYYALRITAKSTMGARATGELIVYRLQMGLHFECEGHVSCFYEPFDLTKHPEPLCVTTDSGKRFAPSLSRALFTLITWNEETNKVVYALPDLSENGEPKMSLRVEPLPPEEDALYADVQSKDTRDLTDAELIKKLNMGAMVSHIHSDNSVELRLFSLGMLDAPSRRKVRLVCDVVYKGKHYSNHQDVWLCSQRFRQMSNDKLTALWKKDKEKTENLEYMRRSLIHQDGMERIFPLIKFIDLMLEGYDPMFGYEQEQYDMVLNVYQAFCRGHIIGANQEADGVVELGLVCDIMRALADNATQLDGIFGKSVIGVLSRMGLGVITMGWSEVGMSVCRISRSMIEVTEREQNPGGAWDAFVVGVKDVTTDFVTEKLWGAVFTQAGIALKTARPEAMARIAKTLNETGGKVKKALGPLGRDVKDIYKDIRQYASDAFGKQAKQTVTTAKASLKAADAATEKAILEVRAKDKGSFAWTEEELKMQADYNTHSQEALKKVREIEHAYHEYRAYRTPETEEAFRKLCLEAQGDKLVQKALINNNSTYAHNVVSEYNKVHRNLYAKVDKEAKQLIAAELNKQGVKVDPDDIYVFNATNGNVDAYENGFAMPRDRDVTFKIKGQPDMDVPQGVSEKCYNEAYTQESGGFDPVKNDQAVVQKGSPEMIGSGEQDLARAFDTKRMPERFDDVDGVARAYEHKPKEWVERSHAAASSGSIAAPALCEEGMRQGFKLQGSEVNIAIVNNSFHLLTEQEQGVMSLLRHLDVANPKTHLRLDISDFAHNLRVIHNMSVDDIGPMLKDIIYRLEAAKPGMTAVKASSGAAATAAQSPVRTTQSIFSNIGQSMGQKMKDVLHAAPVAEGTSKGPDSPRH